MATKVDFAPLAEDVLAALGGKDNIASFAHCATRLRFKVKDSSKADLKKVEKIDGVITALSAGGQHQVVIGNDVPFAYEAVAAIPGMAHKGAKDDGGAVDTQDDEPVEKDANLFNRFVAMISAIFSPVLWCLAGIALGKAFVSAAATMGWMSSDTTTYSILTATFDGLFNFLPFFLAVTAARYFRTDIFVAMAVVAPLLHPTLTALVDSPDPVTLFGIPVSMMSYASSVIPAIVAGWVLSYVERWLNKVLPSAIRNFMVPLLCVTIMVPLVLLTIGPATNFVANGISSGVNWLFDFVPWLAGAVLGAFWQVFVIFGLHWSFVPIMLNHLATQGFTYITAPLMAAVLAQAGAVAAVALRSKNASRRKMAGPATLSAFLAGVTEPTIYGINLPLKTPFYVGCVSGAVDGAIISAGGSAFNSFVFPSILAFPAGATIGSFPMLVIGTVVGIVGGFVGIWILLPSTEAKFDAEGNTENANNANNADSNDTASEASPAGVADTATVGPDDGVTDIHAPIAGKVVALENVTDKVFASGAMGKGLGIKPTDGHVVAPVAGTIIAAPKSGHAFGIKTDNGVELLVHVGLDTVKMKGAGFSVQVARGDRVEAGQLLAIVDLKAIAEAGYEDTTIVVVTNTAKLTDVSVLAADGQDVDRDIIITATR